MTSSAADTRDHPGVQHGYCSTEYREQGSTRYAELQLVTGHVNQRSLTVGMTRHTHEYGMFYSREAVGSYDDLVGLGLRTKSKELASDYLVLERTGLARDDATTRQLSVTAVRLELEPIARGTEGSYSREERKAAFSILNALKPLERDAPEQELAVPEDWHQALHEPSVLRTQIAEVRERVAELDLAAQEQSLDRGLNRGRGRGR